MKVIVGGGGFPQFWYAIGFGRALIADRQPSLIAGMSAGSLVAALLVLSDHSIEDIMDVCVALVRESRPGAMAKVIKNMMDSLLPPDAHTAADGHLGIVVSDPRNGRKCRLITTWDSRDQLISCLIASCYIPGFMACDCRWSDPVYNCRDALFSSNKEAFKEAFDMKIIRPVVGEGQTWSRCFQSLSVPSAKRAWELAAQGEKDWKIGQEHESAPMLQKET